MSFVAFAYYAYVLRFVGIFSEKTAANSEMINFTVILLATIHKYLVVFLCVINFVHDGPTISSIFTGGMLGLFTPPSRENISCW